VRGSRAAVCALRTASPGFQPARPESSSDVYLMGYAPTCQPFSLKSSLIPAMIALDSCRCGPFSGRLE
jgi:hypothetical protein